MNKENLYIGTSGWYYKHWIDRFYPSKIQLNELFDYYTIHFSTVELNNTFYRLPSSKTFENWSKNTPDNFLFSVKASRLITHNKKLIDSERTLEVFLDRVNHLKEKLGPILFQLPPAWKINVERLENFISKLPKGYQFTFEFRNSTWYMKEVFDLLSNYNIAFCIYELEHHTSPIISTADFVYIRLHGPGEKYQGLYSDKSLLEWAERIKEWLQDNKKVYCYFDNDQNAYAAYNALTLSEMIGI